MKPNRIGFYHPMWGEFLASLDIVTVFERTHTRKHMLQMAKDYWPELWTGEERKEWRTFIHGSTKTMLAIMLNQL